MTSNCRTAIIAFAPADSPGAQIGAASPGHTPPQRHGLAAHQPVSVAPRQIPYDRIAWLVIIANIVTQVMRYLECRSLRYDECRLALNLLERDYTGLTRLLDYQQSAPIAFLWIEKLLITARHDEFLLRLFPILMSVAAPVLFWLFARREGSPRAALIGTFLFCLNRHILLHSSEVMQFSLDISCAILALMGGAWVVRTQITLAKVLAVAVLGAVALWFSQPELYIVAGVWTAVAGATLLPLWKPPAYPQLRWPLAIAALTLGSGILCASFLLNYQVVIAPLLSEAWTVQNWEAGFAPYPPWTIDDVLWYLRASSDLMISNRGETYWGLALIPFFLAGVLYVTCTRPWLAAMLVLPIVFAYIASALGRFGFADLQILFLQPCVVFVAACGIEQIVKLISERNGNFEQTAAWGMMAFSVVALPYSQVSGRLEHWNQLETRAALADLAPRVKDGDVIYVTQSMSYAYLYYARMYHTTQNCKLGDWPGLFSASTGAAIGHEGDDPSGYEKEMQQLVTRHPESRRVWVLTATISWLGGDVRPSMREMLEKRGSVEEFNYPGVTIFLLTLP